MTALIRYGCRARSSSGEELTVSAYHTLPLYPNLRGRLVNFLSIATFHYGDPFLEWSQGSHSPLAMTVMHRANPLSAAVGDALAFDWLRMPLMYTGFPGSLSGPISAAQYHPFIYAPWWGSALLLGGVGLVLLRLGAPRRLVLSPSATAK